MFRTSRASFQRQHRFALSQMRSNRRRIPAALKWMSSTPESSVILRKEGRVAVITLNAPDRLNALDIEMGERFQETVRNLCVDAGDVGAVVLTGAGRAFSAGGDLQFLIDRHHDTPSRNAQIMRKFYSRFLSVRDLPVPVIAAVNGPAVGAGLCVALACDLRITHDAAKMGVTFAALGLHPGMGSTFYLPKLVGPQRASHMLLTGELVTGKQALEFGIVLESLSDAEGVLPRAMELATKISEGSPLAVRSGVRTLRMAQDDGLDRALWREADAQSYCYASKDLLDGVMAIKEKRAADMRQFESYTE